MSRPDRRQRKHQLLYQSLRRRPRRGPRHTRVDPMRSAPVALESISRQAVRGIRMGVNPLEPDPCAANCEQQMCALGDELHVLLRGSSSNEQAASLSMNQRISRPLSAGSSHTQQSGAKASAGEICCSRCFQEAIASCGKSSVAATIGAGVPSGSNTSQPSLGALILSGSNEASE